MIFGITIVFTSILFFIKRRNLRLKILPEVIGYNNASKNKPLVEALPILIFALANLLVFMPIIFVTDEMESLYPWLHFVKDLPIHILWGLSTPLALYFLNKEARKHVLEFFKDLFGIAL